MNAQQAWQATLGQLQMEMSKASFDTWVRNAELVKHNQDIFTIGVKNAYARDWLESRLLSTVQRLLTGFMENPQNVQFIVWHQDAELDGWMTSEEVYLPPKDHHSENRSLIDRYRFENFALAGLSATAIQAACAMRLLAPTTKFSKR